MSTIDDKIQNLRDTITAATAELTVLTSTDSGDVAEFIRSGTRDGTLPAEIPPTQIATIVTLWGKFTAARAANATESARNVTRE
jgi:hypothetical protein